MCLFIVGVHMIKVFIRYRPIEKSKIIPEVQHQSISARAGNCFDLSLPATGLPRHPGVNAGFITGAVKDV